MTAVEGLLTMYMNGMASDKLSFLKMVSDIKTDGENHVGQSKEILSKEKKSIGLWL